MTTVTIMRRRVLLRYFAYGLWMNGPAETQTFKVDDQALRPRDLGQGYVARFSIADGVTVTWPDGAVEHAFPDKNGNGHPPECIPPFGRLNALLHGLPEPTHRAQR